MSSQVVQLSEDQLTKEEREIDLVAIYGRKSRGVEDEDLKKHLYKMESLCKVYGWAYVVYEELYTGNSIDDLEKLSTLLEEVEAGKYDAIMVMDQDRLTRGGTSDQQRINYVLKKSNTKVITASPFNVLDLNNEAHEEMIMFKSFSSQMEYKMIKKRFVTGKKISQTMGNWVYGAAPFGYRYNRETKRLVPDEQESEIFREIVEMFSKGVFSTEMAWELNKQGKTTRSGKKWNDSVIRAMLKNPVYTGTTTTNKTSGTPESRTKNKYSISSPFKKNDPSEWLIIENTHPPLLTSEEFKSITDYYKKASKHQVGKTKSVYSLTGLCVSPTGERYTIRKSNDDLILRVRSKDYMELNCEIVEAAIRDSVLSMRSIIEDNLENRDNSAEEKQLEKEVIKKQGEAQKIVEAIDRIEVGFASGLYSIDKAKKLKQDFEIQFAEIEDTIEKLNSRLNSISNVDNIDRKQRLDNFLNDIEEGQSHPERNIIYKEIISSIEVERRSRTEVIVKVNFL